MHIWLCPADEPDSADHACVHYYSYEMDVFDVFLS